MKASQTKRLAGGWVAWAPPRAALRVVAAVMVAAVIAMAHPLAAKALAADRSAERVLHGVVTHVTDGDTVWVQVDPDPVSGQAPAKPVKLRMQGMDAPERCQEGGAQATEALRSRVLRQRVTMRVRGRDDHGRALGRLLLNGEDVNAWMVSQGHAWSYRYRRSLGPYAAQEQQARQARKGLFANDAAMEPRVFRRVHGACPPP